MKEKNNYGKLILEMSATFMVLWYWGIEKSKRLIWKLKNGEIKLTKAMDLGNKFKKQVSSARKVIKIYQNLPN